MTAAAETRIVTTFGGIFRLRLIDVVNGEDRQNNGFELRPFFGPLNMSQKCDRQRKSFVLNGESRSKAEAESGPHRVREKGWRGRCVKKCLYLTDHASKSLACLRTGFPREGLGQKIT
jgi:hypothetical protein